MKPTIYPSPTSIQIGEISVALTGLFMYRDEMAGDASVKAFLQDFCGGTERFDDCTGSYRMQILYPDGHIVAFGDNAGIMRWYIREEACPFIEGNCPPHAHIFCTSLKDAMPSQDRTPNYSAIAQFLYFGCIHGTETILREVRRSDPEKYYIVENGRLAEMDKRLTPLEELEIDGDALDRQMARLVKATIGCEGIVCTITGGTDSRNILVHLLHEGVRPLLDITGADGDVDVKIARQVAERLNLELLWVSDAIEEGTDWIEEAIRAADGMTGVCGIYRLNKKARALKERNISMEYGGLAGEFYKNDYISFDYPFYGGSPNWERFYYRTVASYDFPMELCGSHVLPEMKRLPERLIPWLSSGCGQVKHSAYLAAGRRIMQGGAAGVCAMNCRYYIQYTPLMERPVAAMFCRRAPHSLDNYAYPREKVSGLCPEIKDIRATENITFDTHVTAGEALNYVKGLLRKKLALSIRRNKVRGRRDACFQAGLSSPQCHTALERCKALGILAPEVDGDTLPAPIADRLFALGSML